MELLRLRLQLLEPPFRIDIHCILSILAQVEFRLECLRRLRLCQSPATYPAIPRDRLTRITLFWKPLKLISSSLS
jgi:hypothetical protein